MGKTSQYTYENVCIVPGGRAGMARVAAVIVRFSCLSDCKGRLNESGRRVLWLPDPRMYVMEHSRGRMGVLNLADTTYSEVLSVFKRLVPIPSALNAKNKYKLDVEQLKRDIEQMSMNVIVASNRELSPAQAARGHPHWLTSAARNPTGQCIAGKDLEDLVHLARQKTTVILDEFYSWYMYPDDEKDLGKSLSGARYVEDVDEDPVILINGLTKGFRLPGWRVCWVSPK